MTVSRTQPPHDLSVVIDFVNTRDIEAGTDELGDPGALGAWLVRHGLLASTADTATDADLTGALALREALRDVLVAHTDGRPVPPAALGVLDGVAERGGLSVRYGMADGIALAPRRPGISGALAGILAPPAIAEPHGDWGRVKACAADDCRWAFFDTSRNRSGRWCDMAICGNRTKVRSYRDRNRAG